MGSLLHLICDYAPGDLAWAEVMSAVVARLPEDTRLHMTAVGSFETIATGFALAQLGMAEPELRPENLIVFANTAPRKDKTEARPDNEGEGLLFGALRNSVKILAVNSGFSLSFVREEINELWSTNVKDRGSQFRSRDFFPEIVGMVAKKDYSFKLHEMDPHRIIPEPPPGVIGYVDSFGNLKTTFRAGDPAISDLPSGARLKIRIGSVIRTATVATGSFNVMEGDLAFAPGSSGHDRRFWEFFQRGGSAWSEFGRPAVGTKIHLDKITA